MGGGGGGGGREGKIFSPLSEGSIDKISARILLYIQLQYCTSLIDEHVGSTRRAEDFQIWTFDLHCYIGCYCSCTVCPSD